MKFRRRALLSIPALLSFGVLLPASASEPRPVPSSATDHGGAADRDEAGYLALPDLPLGVAAPGPDGIRRSAVQLAASLRAVPVEEGSTVSCPQDRLTVSWDVPGPSYGHGAFVEPLGPAPTEGTTSVNGVVVCTGADWAFMGFEGRYVGGRWNVVAVPFVDEEIGAHAAGEHAGDEDHGDRHGHGERRGHGDDEVAGPIGPMTSIPLPAPAAPGQRSFSGPIDGYARYEPQRTCAPAAKPGTLALQGLLMEGAPGSRNLGISRACHIGGSSEHKEGRAFDWGVLVHRPTEGAAADAFLTRLLATDVAGNRHALARRMGVMYVIWNQRIWSAYRPNDGWRSYSGRSPHTDHVHISLSWDGALGRTSYWSGRAMEGLSFLSSPTQRVASAPVPTATATAPKPSPPATTAPVSAAPAPSAGHSPAPAHDDGASDRAAHDARKAAEDAARQQQRAAEEEARRQQKAAEERARRAEQVAAEQARQQQTAAEEQARQAQKAAKEAAKEAERRQQKATAPAPSPAPVASGGGTGGGGNGKGGGKGKGR